MSPTSVFLGDLMVAVLLCTGIVLYVAKHLRSLLIELCETAERANFWLAFSNVSLVLLVPLIFALEYKPEFGSDKPVVFEVATQLKYALIGFVVTFGALALLLLWLIPRVPCRNEGGAVARRSVKVKLSRPRLILRRAGSTARIGGLRRWRRIFAWR
jgi:hypothetical protein